MAVMIRKSYGGYSKLDKEDPEDVNHRRAQFLIYKVLQQAETRRRPSNLRIRIRKLKVKIGRRLKKLRKSMLLSISAARVCVYKRVFNQLKTCMTLFGRGDRGTVNATLPVLLT